MKVIGLTGGVGLVKSGSHHIKTKYNAEVMEADKVAHELMERGKKDIWGSKKLLVRLFLILTAPLTVLHWEK